MLYRALAQRIWGSRNVPGEHSRIRGLEHIDKAIEIDQSPIGRTPRSNPATYTSAFTPIRDLFAAVPESRARGYKPGRFSFNVKGGRCEACEGQGLNRIEMQFLPDVYVSCEVCEGARYNREALDITYKGKTIADVLAMTVEDAHTFFQNIPSIERKLGTLVDVGLGYIRLGQPATTLSGGEAQRIKLASELSKRATGKTVYILDEPTTGLHFADTRKLIQVLQRLADAGNTVIVIEHNLDVIKSADWIIDLGPEGGDAGGELIAEGTPEDVAAKPDSYTGQYLQRVLSPGARRRGHSRNGQTAGPASPGSGPNRLRHNPRRRRPSHQPEAPDTRLNRKESSKWKRIGGFFTVIAIIVLYFLPIIIVSTKIHREKTMIVALNFLPGLDGDLLVYFPLYGAFARRHRAAASQSSLDRRGAEGQARDRVERGAPQTSCATRTGPVACRRRETTDLPSVKLSWIASRPSTRRDWRP